MRKKTGPDIRYTVGGEGRPAEPAVITFSFTAQALHIEWVKGQFSTNTTVEEDRPGHFVLKGTNPAMSRLDLTQAFLAAFPRPKWWTKGEDA